MGAMMVALGLGAVCVATTVMAHRPPGMRLALVPMFAWSMLVASSLWIVTLASAFAHVILGQVAHSDAGGLAENFLNGIGWLLRGPSVYVFAIPVLGIAVDALTVAAGRRVAQYGIVQGLIGAYAVLSFGAWAQLPRSVNTVVWTLFALAIALPVLGVLGSLGDLARQGKVAISPAVLLSGLSVVLLLGAVVAGLLQALDLAGKGTLWGFNATALGAAQTYFVVAASIGGGLAGIFHWSPLLWGARVPKAPGTLTVVTVFLGGGLLAITPLVQGIVQLDGKTTASQLWGALVAVGAVIFALGVLNGFLASLSALRSAADGDADDGPDGLTLEWSFPTPAVGGVVLDDLARVTSAYPLLDAREGSDQENS
jgi:cytochrome c oxidase subunit I+III